MTRDYDVKKLKELIKSKDVQAIKSFMKENDLELKYGYISPKDKTYYDKMTNFFNIKQYVVKIFLNSTYGATLQKSCLFYDMRLGASTTCTGRMVVKHLTAKANELLCGKYEPKGYCAEYNDTDSILSSSIQKIMHDGNKLEMTIEELFNSCPVTHIDKDTGKEYGYTKDMVLSYNSKENQVVYLPVNYVYRHKTSKPKWEIEDENGNIITVTSDHSCMVERDGKLITVKPQEILDTDMLITIVEE